MKLLFCLLLLASIAAACRSSTKEFTDKYVIVKSKQTIEEAGLLITNNGCGRKWVADGQHPPFEKIFCDLKIEFDQFVAFYRDFDSVYLHGIWVKIDKINPSVNQEHGLSPGACRLWLRKAE